MNENEHPQYFDPAYVNPARLDPLCPSRWTEFPWPEIFQRVDGEEPESERDYEKAAQALREILWGLTRGSDLAIIALRALALCEKVAPEHFATLPDGVKRSAAIRIGIAKRKAKAPQP